MQPAGKGVEEGVGAVLPGGELDQDITSGQELAGFDVAGHRHPLLQTEAGYARFEFGTERAFADPLGSVVEQAGRPALAMASSPVAVSSNPHSTVANMQVSLP